MNTCRPVHRRYATQVGAVCLLTIATVACRQTAPPPPAPLPSPPAVDKVAPQVAPDAALPAPATAAATADAPDAPPATPAAAAIAAQAVAFPEESVALHVGAPDRPGFQLPEPGKPAQLRVTPIGASGQPLVRWGRIDGHSDMIALAHRRDWAWTRAVTPAAAEGGTRTFEVTFALPGPHAVLFVRRRPDGSWHKDRASLRVQGPWQAGDVPAARASWRGDGLEVALGGDAPAPCLPWVPPLVARRGGKPVSITGTWTVFALSTADDETLVVADGAAASALVLPQAGRWWIVARALVGKTIVHAHMFVDTAGTVPPTGCPSLAAPAPPGPRD